MPRFKDYSYEQTVFLTINFKKQIMPETFEYTLNNLIDKKIDLSVFEERIHNDETGSPAYDPAILLKIILFAYSRSINTSSAIARLCQENIICMALSADTFPHYTTIADFISSNSNEIIDLFTRILSVCYTQNIIGKNMFAIDGCKISSNCSKEWSGTKKELLEKAGKIEKAVAYLVTKHKEADKNRYNKSQEKKEKESIKKIKARAYNKFRKRDVRFKDAGRYKKKAVNWKPRKGKKYFTADDFVFNELTAKMLRRFDTPEGRSIYSKRMGTVELVILHCS